MKLIDKLKNALFEEEYVEVEEKPKRKEIRPEEKKKKEEKPIAKKIVQPKEEPKKEKIEVGKDEHLGESLAYEGESQKQEFKFPMVSDSEFGYDEEIEKLDEDIEEKTEERPVISDAAEETSYNRFQQKKVEHKPYGIEDYGIDTHEYGLYEKKDDRTYFKPSPIISPIYGILDKDYKKEEIVTKKEIRLTSSYGREKIDVDDVRRKAFGRAEKRETRSDYEEENVQSEDQSENNLMDLSSDAKTPEVKKVTVGDAEEYFEDLGLEYNVDYKDTSKTEEKERRTTRTKEKTESSKARPKKEKTKATIEESDDDNLFDLIDSMYDEK